LMATIVEAHHDDRGIIWPKEVSPYLVHLLPINMRKKEIVTQAEKIYKDLQKRGIEVLYDDQQDVSAGEKLAESDLFGIPYRILISEKTLKENSVELKERNKIKPEFIKINKLSNFKF